MKRKYNRTLSIWLAIILIGASSFAIKEREFYEVRIYYFDKQEQEKRLDQYLQDALIPALHRQKISRVGVFKPIANDTAAVKRMVVFIPYKKMKQFLELEDKLARDGDYLSKGADYINTVYSNPAYTRMEKIILKAFEKMPEARKPDLKSAPSERVYELRSYESASEKIYRNKVSMFNEGGEVALFKRLGFNAVFYGEVQAGAKMPNLMYMTSFENLDARNAHWKTFSDDAEWKTLSGLPQYQKNVSKSEIILMHGVSYSDL